MTILTEKKVAEAAKELGKLYYIAIHWEELEEDLDNLQITLEAVANLASIIGSMHMMVETIPALVAHLENERREALLRMVERWEEDDQV